jgi:hypothetical protein
MWEEIDRATRTSAGLRGAHLAGLFHANWDGPMLSVTTTHLKMGYIRRNGVARSDRARVIEHFIRHGN